MEEMVGPGLVGILLSPARESKSCVRARSLSCVGRGVFALPTPCYILTYCQVSCHLPVSAQAYTAKYEGVSSSYPSSPVEDPLLPVVSRPIAEEELPLCADVDDTVMMLKANDVEVTD